MSRYNIFNAVHKALRTILYDTATLLQQTNFMETAEAETAFEKVREVVDVFKLHAAQEKEYVWPAIQRYEPSIADLFQQEHEKDPAMGEGLLGLIVVYRHAIKAGVKIETGQAINRAFTGFLIVNLGHMAREEAVLNKILWRYYTDRDLGEISSELLTVSRGPVVGTASAFDGL